MTTAKRRLAEIVKSGVWKYDGTVDTDVYVIRQNWDYYYDEGFEDEPEQLNPEGVVYHVAYVSPIPSTTAVMSLEEAIAEAQATITGPIDWNDRKIGPVPLPVCKTSQ